MYKLILKCLAEYKACLKQEQERSLRRGPSVPCHSLCEPVWIQQKTDSVWQGWGLKETSTSTQTETQGPRQI